MAKVKNEMMRDSGKKKKTSTALAKDDGAAQRRQDAIALFQKQGYQAIAEDQDAAQLDEIGLVEKDTLVGIPFHVLFWGFHAAEKSDYNNEWVSVTVGLQDGTVVVFNDGSTGVRDQLLEYVDKGITGPIKNCTLRKSEYENEYTKEGITFYLTKFVSKEALKAKVAASAANGSRARA